MQTIIGTDIELAASFLLKDNIVAIPTETVYGLAGNALSETAVSKIYAAKNRPSFNPLILHVGNLNAIEKYANIDPISWQIAQNFMPGPITLLLPKKNTVPDITTAGSSKVAIRVPNHPMALALLNNINFPLAAPSANPSGYISPTTANHVLEGLNGKINYILDGGPTTVGVESTICEVTDQHIVLHRAGGISAKQLSDLTGLEVKLVADTAHSATSFSPATAGQMKSHYAPKTPLYRGDIAQLIQMHAGKKIAIISFDHYYEANNATCFTLSPTGDLAVAANQLFATLRKIDQANFDIILAAFFPEHGIGNAINDRIGRAQFIHK